MTGKMFLFLCNHLFLTISIHNTISIEVLLFSFHTNILITDGTATTVGPKHFIWFIKNIPITRVNAMGILRRKTALPANIFEYWIVINILKKWWIVWFERAICCHLCLIKEARIGKKVKENSYYTSSDTMFFYFITISTFILHLYDQVYPTY